MNAEEKRLGEARLRKAPWKKRGPHLGERQWGTVREDYSDRKIGAAVDSAGRRATTPRREDPSRNPKGSES